MSYDCKKGVMMFNTSNCYANLENDARAYSVLHDIANSINKSIQMEPDHPSLHSDGRVPVLDLSVWIYTDNHIQYSFYKKAISSPFLMMYRSAVSGRTKRTSLIQERIRRQVNMSPGVSQEERNEVMSRYMHAMMISVYYAPFRLDIIKAVTNRIEVCENDIKEGKRIRLRHRSEVECDKLKRTGKFANTWFLTCSNTVVFNVPCTPGGQMIDDIKEALRSHRGPYGGTTKVVETAGARVSKGLVRNDTFKDKSCPYPTKCMCKDTEDCTSAKVVYRVDCKLCLCVLTKNSPADLS